MRHISIVLISHLIVGPVVAQATKDPDRAVKDGGVMVPGWTGRLDPSAEKRGAKITEASFFPAGDGLHVTSGPAAVYWNPANKGEGSYVVKATIAQTKAPTRSEYYGVFMGGSSLDKPNQNYLFCVVAGDGTYAVKHHIGGEVHELAGRTAHGAIRKADATGKTSNEVALKVTPERTACLVNGTEVWGYPSTGLVGEGKLVSTNGIGGLRVNHNLDLHITGFSVGK